MKQFGSSEASAALISICPSKEEKNLRSSHVYSREFQAMLESLEEEDCTEESRQSRDKKRRLSLDQVKALERSFDLENKLEPERKLRLAEELGLQPRQVAIWFQNRRARWKTKQLERDYGVLKANYDALKLSFSDLEKEKEALAEELRNLKTKLLGENAESSHSAKEESPPPANGGAQQSEDRDAWERHRGSSNDPYGFSFCHGDSSGALGEDSDMGAQLRAFPLSSHSILTNWHQAPETRGSSPITIKPCLNHHPPAKPEEQSFFTAEDSCNFLSVDQAPTLQWYLPQQ